MENIELIEHLNTLPFEKLRQLEEDAKEGIISGLTESDKSLHKNRLPIIKQAIADFWQRKK